MAWPVIGHLDPQFISIMEETKALLRRLFQTDNELTFPVSGTGSAGMEACLANLIEPGDQVIVCVNGVFGRRMADIVRRCQGVPVVVEAAWGEIIEPEDVERALADSGAKMVAVVHAETSTGVLQPLTELSRIVREREALFLVDTVTSLGGFPVQLDTWGIDAVYSGTQKCLSCPPGLAPISFSPRAIAALDARRTPVQSWYLDLTMVRRYWGEERLYHHTAPISMVYALHEALRIIFEEGLDQRFARHKQNHEALLAGLAAMGLDLLPREGHRLWMLNAIVVPEGVDETRVRQRLLDEFGMEVGGGLADLKGKIWRVGLMGHSSTRNNVLLFLAALEHVLRAEGYTLPSGAGVAAAQAEYAEGTQRSGQH